MSRFNTFYRGGFEEEREVKDAERNEDKQHEDFEEALVGLLTELLPNARTRWREPIMQGRRPSPRWVHVRCPLTSCGACCLVNMTVAFPQLAANLAAVGVTADRLPAGPLREVLTRPRGQGGEAPAASGGGRGSGGAGGSGDGKEGPRGAEDAEQRAAEEADNGQGAGPSCSAKAAQAAGGDGAGGRGSPGGDDEAGGSGGGGEAGGSGAAAAAAAGASVRAQEWVEWTYLPQWAKRLIQKTARWGWFAGGERLGAYGNVNAHLLNDHELPQITRRLLWTPGGDEEDEFSGQVGIPMPFSFGFEVERQAAPDDPEVLQFAAELGQLMDAHCPTTAHRCWGEDTLIFGLRNDVVLRCPVPGCDLGVAVRMGEGLMGKGAYDSFKICLRECLPAADMPPGLVRDVLVSPKKHFGKTCYNSWGNLPKFAQLGFIRAARWRWFEKEWHTEDPYDLLRIHFAREHAGDAEATRLKALLLDREGEEAEDTTDNPNRQRRREAEAYVRESMQKYENHKRARMDEGGRRGRRRS